MSWFSSIPLLFLAQFLFLAAAARRAAAGAPRPSHAMTATVAVGGALLAWGVASGWLALSGVYDSDAFLGLLPGLWITTISMMIVLLLILVVGPVRIGLGEILRETPAHWLVGIQVLRISALGTLIRSLQNEFPHHVEIAIGLPDLAYGISALFIYPLARAGRLSSDALIIWHAVGILLLVVAGPASIQTGLPGPLQLFHEPPTAETMFDFPMVLAPSVVVPAFMMLNLLGIAAARATPAPEPR